MKTCFTCSVPLVGPHVRDLYKCPSCGLLARRELPSKEDTKKLLANWLLGACKNPEIRKRRLGRAATQMELIGKYTEPTKLYDVGAAGGFVLKAAKDVGWEVRGNELSVKGIEYSDREFGITLDYGFLEDLDYSSEYGTYGAVVLWNTLEHTYDPDKTIDICRDLLADGGLIHINVPNKTEEELDKYYEGGHFYEFGLFSLSKLMILKGFQMVEGDNRPEIERNKTVPPMGMRILWRKEDKVRL